MSFCISARSRSARRLGLTLKVGCEDAVTGLYITVGKRNGGGVTALVFMTLGCVCISIAAIIGCLRFDMESHEGKN